MGKKFVGENSKASVARERKNAAKEEQRQKVAKAKEDALWEDNDKHVQRKMQRKEEQERKRTEAVEKKQENRRAYEEEMSSVAKDKQPVAKLTQAQIHSQLKLEREQRQAEKDEAEASRRKVEVTSEDLHENLNRVHVGDVARNVDEAIKVLNVTSKEEPKISVKAAYTDFESRRLPQLKVEKPTLRLSQLKQLLKKEWQKSPENPLNEKIMSIIK